LRLVTEGRSWNGEVIPDEVFSVDILALEKAAVEELQKKAARLAEDQTLTAAECELWELVATESFLILEGARGRS
jgi:hypothetical protein